MTLAMAVELDTSIVVFAVVWVGLIVILKITGIHIPRERTKVDWDLCF